VARPAGFEPAAPGLEIPERNAATPCGNNGLHERPPVTVQRAVQRGRENGLSGPVLAETVAPSAFPVNGIQTNTLPGPLAGHEGQGSAGAGPVAVPDAVAAPEPSALTAGQSGPERATGGPREAVEAALALGRAIEAVNALPLSQTEKASLIRRMGGLSEPE